MERSFAWLNHYRRLAIRYALKGAFHQSFLDLAYALICRKAMRRQTPGLCKG